MTWRQLPNEDLEQGAVGCGRGWGDVIVVGEETRVNAVGRGSEEVKRRGDLVTATR